MTAATMVTSMTPTSATPADACWTVVASLEGSDLPSVQELKTQLEKGKELDKIETMKTVLSMMMGGDLLPQLMMHVIRFVLPSKNKALKKLLLVYWELCPKHNSDGKLKQEMILVCNYLRNDLQSPNEFVRGMTLRFLCKLREQELLEPLIPSCRTSLEHRHPYVRKNAVFAIFTIFKHFEHLIPDAPELIANYLQQETDSSCRRNAFLMLCNTDYARAVAFLNSIFAQITTLDESMQMAVIDLIRKDSKSNLAAKGNYIRTIFALLLSPSNAVKFEAASALMSLTSSPLAVKEVGACYIDLAVKESDINVKAIVLERLSDLQKEHDRVLEEKTMDVLRVMSCPDIHVCRKTVQICLDMVSTRNVADVIAFFKKEISKTHDVTAGRSAEFRQLLIYAIHQCAIKFPDVAPSVVSTLMEFLGDDNSSSAVDVIVFTREVVERNNAIRKDILLSMFNSFANMKSGKVMRGALWITGEYSLDMEAIDRAFAQIRTIIGEVPILAAEQKLAEADAEETSADSETVTSPKPPATGTTRRVLADGTYATESALTTISPTSPSRRLNPNRPPLRQLIMSGDYFLAAVLATCLTKLVLRATKIGKDQEHANTLRAEAMLIMTGLINVGLSKFVTIPMDEDSYDRILTCIRIIGNVEQPMREIFMEHCRAVYSKMVQEEDKKKKEADAKDQKSRQVPVDQVLGIRQLKARVAGTQAANEFEMDIKKATGAHDFKRTAVNRLNRIIQLTGFSDPVYAEAFVDVHQYDILLDIMVVNQTTDTLQNLTVEFATLGDLKLVERPTSYTMAPRSFQNIKANIKVSSTETGVIFGNIVYDGPGTGDSHVVVLNDIHIDIMDYIKPATCSDNQFRAMWTEFEWENKVNVNTNITNARQFLDHILKCTNMKCLTPERSLSGDCGFLAANLYARSIFGEDALANITLEQQGDSPLSGHIRIRSKTQGIALSLGDKITLTQKIKA